MMRHHGWITEIKLQCHYILQDVITSAIPAKTSKNRLHPERTPTYTVFIRSSWGGWNMCVKLIKCTYLLELVMWNAIPSFEEPLFKLKTWCSCTVLISELIIDELIERKNTIKDHLCLLNMTCIHFGYTPIQQAV